MDYNQTFTEMAKRIRQEREKANLSQEKLCAEIGITRKTLSAYETGKYLNISNMSLETEENMRKFYSSQPETFDNASPYFRWKAEWTVADLEKTLSKTLPTVKNTGFVRTKKEVDYSNPNFLGHIKSIYVNKRGLSGKIVALTVITDKNEFTIFKELIIRKVFQYNNKKRASIL